MDAFPPSAATSDDSNITEVRYLSWRPNKFDPAIDEPPTTLMQPVQPEPVLRGKDPKIHLIAHKDYDEGLDGWGSVRTITAPEAQASQNSVFGDQTDMRDTGSVVG